MNTRALVGASSHVMLSDGDDVVVTGSHTTVAPKHLPENVRAEAGDLPVYRQITATKIWHKATYEEARSDYCRRLMAALDQGQMMHRLNEPRRGRSGPLDQAPQHCSPK